MIPNPITFRIIQPHIDLGVPNDDCHCPVYLALRQRLGDVPISVGRMYIKIALIWYEVPEDLSRWLFSYDEFKAVQPATFTLSTHNAKLTRWAKREAAKEAQP